MQKLGKLEMLDYFILFLVIIQAYWNYKQFKISEKQNNILRTA